MAAKGAAAQQPDEDTSMHGGMKLEREAFSKRLREALVKAGYFAIGPSDVARHFNVRSARKVTGSAVRKWLFGEAIPSQTNISTLAHWLSCGAEWLRYGETADEDGAAGGQRQIRVPQPITEETEMIHELASLDANAKQMVAGLVKVLLESRTTR
jgi:hypothetical protein